MTNLLILGLIAAVVIWAWRSRNVLFRIDWRQRQARLTRGRLTARLVDSFGRTLADANAPDGWIEGIQERRRVRLRFSRRLPDGVRQQLRNLWELERT